MSLVVINKHQFMNRYDLIRYFNNMPNHAFPHTMFLNGLRRDGCFEDDKGKRFFAVGGKQFLSRSQAVVHLKNDAMFNFIPKYLNKFSVYDWLTNAVKENKWPDMVSDAVAQKPGPEGDWLWIDRSDDPERLIPGDWMHWVWLHLPTNTFHGNLEWCSTRIEIKRGPLIEDGVYSYTGRFTGLIEGEFDSIKGFLKIAKYALKYRSKGYVVQTGLNGFRL